MKPTALELWFEGSFFCRFGHFDIIRKGEQYYRVNTVTDNVDAIPDFTLKQFAM